tara:strand:- start:40 stop:327 length:288 start_codon:yes stop_codon:yes gene_type:complete
MKSFIRFILFFFIGVVISAIFAGIAQSELIILLGFGILIYLIPTLIAFARKVPSAASITALNVFLGWSIIGFVIALIWSLKNYDYVPPDLRNTEK